MREQIQRIAEWLLQLQQERRIPGSQKLPRFLAASDIHGNCARLEEVIAVLRQAWTGEPFEYEGHTVRVQPSPVTPGGPIQVMGGSSTIAFFLMIGLVESVHLRKI